MMMSTQPHTHTLYPVLPQPIGRTMPSAICNPFLLCPFCARFRFTAAHTGRLHLGARSTTSAHALAELFHAHREHIPCIHTYIYTSEHTHDAESMHSPPPIFHRKLNTNECLPRANTTSAVPVCGARAICCRIRPGVAASARFSSPMCCARPVCEHTNCNCVRGTTHVPHTRARVQQPKSSTPYQEGIARVECARALALRACVCTITNGTMGQHQQGRPVQVWVGKEGP